MKFSLQKQIWKCFLKSCVACLFVELEPGLVVLGVGVLEPEEPDLPEPDGLDDLVEELLARRVRLDGELELGVDRRHAHVHRLRHRA